MLPSQAITAVAVAPGGAHPSYAHGYYDRDNAFYVALGCDQPRSRDASPPGCSATCSTRATARSTCAAWATRGAGRVSDEAAGDYTADEMMSVAAARRLRDGAVCFVGIGLPSRAANLARSTHAPKCVLIYESGTIGAKPRAPAALDRRRRAGRDRRRRRLGARDLQLLAAGRAHRRRLPGRRPDRPPRQPQQHRDRPLRPPEGAPAGRAAARPRSPRPAARRS